MSTTVVLLPLVLQGFRVPRAVPRGEGPGVLGQTTPPIRASSLDHRPVIQGNLRWHPTGASCQGSPARPGQLAGPSRALWLSSKSPRCWRGLRQESEHREGDQKSVGFVSRGKSERSGERTPLRLGEHTKPTEHRSEQLMQPRESQFHLRFDTNTAGHSDTGCP